MGGLFAVFAIAVAAFLSIRGHEIVAGIIGGATVVAITVALVTGAAAPKGDDSEA